MSDSERTDRNACPEPLTDDRPLWELTAERHAQLVVEALDRRTAEILLVQASYKGFARERFDTVMQKIDGIERGLADVKRLAVWRSIAPTLAIGGVLVLAVMFAAVVLPTVARAAGLPL